MTNQEMTEIFSMMMLVWPNAEMFKGGIQKLGPTIRLWTVCLADIDRWTLQQAAIRVCKTCKFPPTIAEMREAADGVRHDIEAEITDAFYLARNEILNEILFAQGNLSKVYHRLPDRTQKVLTAMGGIEKLAPKDSAMFNLQGFEETYQQMLKNSMQGLPASSSRRKELI